MSDEAAAAQPADPGTMDLSSIDPNAIEADAFDTETVAKLVASTPEEKLKEAMEGPLRDVIVGEVFRRMPERLNPGTAAGADVVVNWEITRDGGEPDLYTVRVSGGACTVETGRSANPRVSLKLAPATFLRLVTGNLNPVTAFMAGQISVEGDLMFAATVPNLFVIPAGGGAAPHSAGDPAAESRRPR